MEPQLLHHGMGHDLLPILIHHAREPTENADEHLVHKPFVARPWLRRSLSVFAKSRPKRMLHQSRTVFVADHPATSGQDRLDVAQAEAKAAIQPDGLLNDLGRRTETTVGLGEVVMARSLPCGPGTSRPDNASGTRQRLVICTRSKA
jgi:hypothetical protein